MQQLLIRGFGAVIRGHTSSSPGTGLDLSGRSPGSRIWGVGTAVWCLGVDSLMSGAVVVGRSCLSHPVGRGLRSNSWSFSCLYTCLVLLGSACTFRLGMEVVSRFKSPWEETKGHPAQHSLRFCKEWGEETAPGLVFPRADISISQTPLAALSRPSSTRPDWEQSIP